MAHNIKMLVSGRKNYPLLFKVLLARLIIKLARDRLAGEKQSLIACLPLVYMGDTQAH